MTLQDSENGRPLLEAENLTKRYEDGVLALDHVSFAVLPKQIYAMLGANGAGKTTTINLFLNFIEPTEGEARIDGIAIAILKDAPAILLDEPTSGLDPQAGFEFIRLLEGLRDEGKAILMSTHDIFRAKEIADVVGIMKQGQLVMQRTREELTGESLENLYMAYMAGHVEAVA